MNKGWISLHRQIENNPLWLEEKFTRAQAWIDLVLFANHTKGWINIRGNIVPIGRGQLGWSELTMAKRWKWSKNKVRRYLNWLETEQQIKQQKYRYITTITTILNYDKYQNDTADDTADGQQTDSRRYINNKNNNDNKKKGRFTPPSLKELEDYIKEKNYKNVDADTFLNFYQSKGWLVGKSKMQEWKATVRGWESRNKKTEVNELEEFLK